LAENKTMPTKVSVEAFLASVPDPARQADARELVSMMRAATRCEPQMWGASIIGFDRYRYVYDSGHGGESALVGFAPRKEALVLYLMPGLDQEAELMGRLGKHKLGKGCLYIKRLAEVDRAVLAALIDRSVAVMRERWPASG